MKIQLAIDVASGECDRETLFCCHRESSSTNCIRLFSAKKGEKGDRNSVPYPTLFSAVYNWHLAKSRALKIVTTIQRFSILI